jgi:hypothetical protein
MQTGIVPDVDTSNAVYQIEIQKDNPSHLDNLVTRLHTLNSQTSADTKFDPKAPPRVDKSGKIVNEAFYSNNNSNVESSTSAVLDIPDTKIIGQILYALGGLSAIILVMTFFIFLDPKLYNNIQQVTNGVRFTIYAGIISVVNMSLIYMSLKYNEIILWYPALKHARTWY